MEFKPLFDELKSSLEQNSKLIFEDPEIFDKQYPSKSIKTFLKPLMQYFVNMVDLLYKLTAEIERQFEEFKRSQTNLSSSMNSAMSSLKSSNEKSASDSTQKLKKLEDEVSELKRKVAILEKGS